MDQLSRCQIIVDIDKTEARKVIALLEFLFEQWYIGRKEDEDMLTSLTGISKAKKSHKDKH